MSTTFEPAIRWERRSTIAADDGVPLVTREYGPEAAPLTVIFAHGHCLNMQSWELQRSFLQCTFGSEIRLVFYDQRGHGESGPAAPDTMTIEQLGQDLDSVIRAVGGSAPIALVGHSMGGMSILSWARQHPEKIGFPVVAAGLIATAASELTGSGIARSLSNPLVLAATTVARHAPWILGAGRVVAGKACERVVRHAAYGRAPIHPRLITCANTLINDTASATILGFLPAFVHLDETAGVKALAPIPTMVLCGSGDLMTPYTHSQNIAEQLPLSELVPVPDAGHMVLRERAPVVSEAIVRLLTRVRAAREPYTPAAVEPASVGA
ncbi:alpha/beta fold hydrolase [Rhodococcus jostii]|uniref:Pimeloyl-ACP methyl ester carboxylesterase n=1 Tax=Rhodococcus jostii TaxID=132919 RepID=A0A1H5M2Z5_RHOJO|nr:alpha/beta hydrolase [Rhodococcus jostii]SEE83739.1 Pimeloyl-ACP methyl ester carboxylesterase [Rhodococcus jostii]